MFRVFSYGYQRRRFQQVMKKTKIGKEGQEQIWQLLVKRGRKQS